MADMERIGMKVIRSNSANEIVAELLTRYLLCGPSD